MSSVDWTQIRQDYEGGLSLRQLATKYSVSKSVIGKRKFDEKWQEPQRTGQKDTRTVPQTQEVVRPDMNAAVRASLGFKLRFQEGKTWEEVAARAGYGSRGAAHDAVTREARRHITHNIEEARDMERYRLEQLQQRCYEAGTDKENAYWQFAIDRFVTLSKRKSELLGMDVKPDDAAMANIVVIREVPTGYLGLEPPKA